MWTVGGGDGNDLILGWGRNMEAGGGVANY